MSRYRMTMAVLMPACLSVASHSVVADMAPDRVRKSGKGMVTAPEDAVSKHM